MSTKIYPGGSQWRVWDLHIHTPESFHWNYGKRFAEMSETEIDISIEEFILAIEGSEPTVFGIVDYFTFGGYFRIQDYLYSARS